MTTVWTLYLLLWIKKLRPSIPPPPRFKTQKVCTLNKQPSNFYVNWIQNVFSIFVNLFLY